MFYNDKYVMVFFFLLEISTEIKSIYVDYKPIVIIIIIIVLCVMIDDPNSWLFLDPELFNVFFLETIEANKNK